MRNLFVCLICFLPALSFAAVDVSDCEVIGYQQGKLVASDCVTVESCQQQFADFPQDLKVCLRRVKKTPEECAEYVQTQNDRIEKYNLIYKCPATVARLEQRAKPKDHTNEDLVYKNGKPIDFDKLANDNKNVYLFHEKAGFTGFLHGGTYSVIGTPEKPYGWNMVAFEE